VIKNGYKYMYMKRIIELSISTRRSKNDRGVGLIFERKVRESKKKMRILNNRIGVGASEIGRERDRERERERDRGRK
jgi:hypothetical protein